MRGRFTSLPLAIMDYKKKIILIFLFTILLFSHAYAEPQVTEGYDENTELTVKGSVKDIQRGMRGPVILILQARNKDYKVVTAPPWYLAQQGIDLTSGTSYEVTGSKYIAGDGNIYIIAFSLKNLSTGKISALRDSSFRPLWRGQHMRRGMNPEAP